MKKIFSLVLIFALVFSLSCFCLADDTYTNAQLNFVTDEIGALSEEQRAALEEYAQKISDTYACGVYMVIVNDYSQYRGGEGGIYSFATTVFNEYTLGYGDSADGVLLALSMADRDYSLIAHGDFGNRAFTDYGKDVLAETFLDDFARNDWFAGFSDYVLNAEQMMQYASQGTPVDVPQTDDYGYDDYGYDNYGREEQQRGITGAGAAIIAFISGIVSFISTSVMKKKMTTAVAKTDANTYIPAGGASLVGQRDDFTHTTVTRVPIQTSPARTGGGHSGGGTTIHSGGFSGKSGKF